MRPLTKKQARIFAAGYTSGPFSYYNIKDKSYKTVAYYRGDSPLYIERDANDVFNELLDKEQRYSNARM